MNNNTEKRQLKKWVIQAIISIMLFAMLYMCEQYTSEPATIVNNFREYALVHNTDFKYIYNNTANTMTTMVDMMFEPETARVFNNTPVAEETAEPTASPTPTATPTVTDEE